MRRDECVSALDDGRYLYLFSLTGVALVPDAAAVTLKCI